VHHYAYAGLALGALLEGETVVALAAVAAREGYLSLQWVIAAGAAGGLAADALGFAVGRWCGPRLTKRWRRLAVLRARVRERLQRHGDRLVVGLRFAYGLRVAGAMTVGMSGMSWLRFAGLSVIGASLWAILVGSAGYYLGAAVLALL
jgi:membrane protein DedA with SNARE-associated domain